MIEVNVGLDVTGGINTNVTHRQRDIIARSVLGQIAPAKFLRHTSHYTTDAGGHVTEQSLIARLPGARLDDALRATIHTLAERIGQDCISVSTGESGELIGPRLGGWTYRPEFFVTYADALEAQRIAA